jgi:hypothetical protein
MTKTKAVSQQAWPLSQTCQSTPLIGPQRNVELKTAKALGLTVPVSLRARRSSD